MSPDQKLSEWEKMITGQGYYANDPDLSARRLRSRQLTFAYNQSPPDEPRVRREILEKLLALQAKAEIVIEPPFHCDYGENIVLEGDFYANFGLVILDCAPIAIGHQVMIGPHSQICAATHPLDPKLRVFGLESARPIAIGSRTWLGAGVIVLPGVTIGEDTVIGAGSVVTRDIPAGVLACGNPCRVIRNISGLDY